MRTSQQRIAKFKARMQSSLLDPQRAATRDSAVQHYTAYANAFEGKQNTLRDTLNALSVDTTTFFYYEAFNGEMYHLSRTAAGPAAVVGAEALVVKYTLTGICTAVTLKAICLNVYGITVP